MPPFAAGFLHPKAIHVLFDAYEKLEKIIRINMYVISVAAVLIIFMFLAPAETFKL